MAHLEALKGPRAGPFLLAKEEVLIGRSLQCDLVIKDVTVSRVHARIVRRADAFFIEDRASRRGTFLNGTELSGERELKDSDLIQISENVFKFHVADPVVPGGAGTADRHESIIMSTTNAVVDPDQTERGETGLKLRAVMEIIRCLHSAVHMDDLLPRILDSLFRIFPQADQGVILLRDDAGGERLVPRAARNRTVGGEDSPSISQTIIDQALEKKQAILSADALSDEQFKTSYSISTFGIHSLMCVPLLDQYNEPLGILQVHTEGRGRPFTQDDLDLLVTVANTTAMALENLRLHEDLLAKEKMHRELQLARDVQRRFLPATAPKLPGYWFSACYKAADSVGGDYYGFMELPGDRLAISVGDVSGKGMPAAMLMARLSSDIRFSAIADPDPARALEMVNHSLSEAEIEDKFITLILMVLDKAQHTVTLASAGHIPPMIRRASGEIEELGQESAGYPLNVDPRHCYRTCTFSMEPGSMLIAYTDGVIEAMNAQRKLFGVKRLREFLGNYTGDPSGMGERILQEVRGFAAGSGQNDDITVVGFGRSR